MAARCSCGHGHETQRQPLCRTQRRQVPNDGCAFCGKTHVACAEKLREQRFDRQHGEVHTDAHVAALAAADLPVYEGFEPRQLEPAPDLVVVGNAGLPRGTDSVEWVFNSGLPYTSGAEWLGKAVLPGRWTLAVAGKQALI